MKCVSGHKSLLVHQLCLNPQISRTGNPPQVPSYATLSPLKAENLYNQNGLVAPVAFPVCSYFYVILNRKATALSINHLILRLFINNHSTYTDIPTTKGKQLKPPEL